MYECHTEVKPSDCNCKTHQLVKHTAIIMIIIIENKNNNNNIVPFVTRSWKLGLSRAPLARAWLTPCKNELFIGGYSLISHSKRPRELFPMWGGVL